MSGLATQNQVTRFCLLFRCSGEVRTSYAAVFPGSSPHHSYAFFKSDIVQDTLAGMGVSDPLALVLTREEVLETLREHIRDTGNPAVSLKALEITMRALQAQAESTGPDGYKSGGGLTTAQIQAIREQITGVVSSE